MLDKQPEASGAQMDSDEEVQGERRLALEEEMSKLRCNSASPSALSTASSGSPLVRGPSSTGKRPAPTSIAAAQLQCQQQQFSNRLLGGQPAKSGGQPAPAPAAKQRQEAKRSAQEADKSLGYRLAKSLAFRAYRFNEFWSVNKLRYMNLACLLMTLICLAAILLLAGNNGARAPVSSGRRPAPADEPAAEGSPGSSQPLVAGGELGDFDERLAADETAAGRKPRRKPEGELEDNQAPDFGDPINRLESLVEPIMSQLFDQEFGSLHNLLRQRANLSRPLVRRTKNGATITISSSFVGANETGANDTSPLPQLLERLLLRPGAGGPRRDSSDNSSNLAATATITIGAEPMFAASAAPFGALRMSSGPFSPLEALFGPPPPPLPFMPRPRRLFVEPQQHRFGMGPFGLWGPPPPLPPPGLLNMMMMMRAQQDQQDQSPEEPHLSRFSEWPLSGGNKTQQDQQPTTSQQSNSTTATKSGTGSGPQEQQQQQQQEASESGEFEVVAPAGRRLQSLYSSRSRLASSPAGSMVIFSSGPMDPSDLPPFAGPLAGLLPPPPHLAGGGPPQVMLVNGDGSRTGDGLMSPLIKSLLSNVMGDLVPGAELVPATSGHANKSSTNSTASAGGDKQARGSSRAPAWMSPLGSSDPDDDWAPLGAESTSSSASSWDEKEGKQLRARHKSQQQQQQQELGDELDDGPASFLAGLQLEPAAADGAQPVATRHFRRVEMVPAGLKSQSLSRAAGEEEAEGAGPSRHRGRLAAAFLRPPAQQNDRRLDEAEGPLGLGSDLAPFGFIGKLLSDLSSHRHEARQTGSSGRSRSLDLDDLDEGDSSQSEQSQEPAGALLRPLRVASARIRMMRPTLVNQAGEPTPFLPAHFSVSAEPTTDEKEEPANRLDEGALSSAEDRIRLTLNQIYHQSPEPLQQQQPPQKAFVLGPIPRGATIPIPLVQQQQHQQQQQQQVKKGDGGNPFTSPSSPLFGFPANSQPAAGDKAPAKLAPAPSQQAPGASRQQRSFTYHSNNEIAGPFQSTASQQRQPTNQHHQQPAETQARSRVVAPLTPPPPPPSFMGPAVGAAGIMGRRLDDLNEASAHPHARENY